MLVPLHAPHVTPADIPIQREATPIALSLQVALRRLPCQLQQQPLA